MRPQHACRDSTSLRHRWLALAFASGLACRQGGTPDGPDDEPDRSATEAHDPWLADHRATIDAAMTMSVEEFAKTYPEPEYAETLGYDPAKAELLGRVTRAYPLDDAQRETLNTHGFVVVPQSAGGFTDNYFWAYQRDLPVMITADSLLHAWHSSYDTMLAKIEAAHLEPALERAMAALHGRVAAAHRDPAFPQSLRHALGEADVFTMTALTLLRDEAVASATGDATLAARASALALRIERAEPGGPPLQFGGVPQSLDFTQFTPRGRYTDSPELQRYFRAMQWLGRGRMRVVDHAPDGAPRLDRPALDTAIVLGRLLRSLQGPDSLAPIDAALTRLVGPMDGATFEDAAARMLKAGTQAEGAASLAAYAALDDATAQQLANTLFAETARIDPQGSVHNAGGEAPIDIVAFAQRYTFDSRVLHDVTFDRLMDAAGEPIHRTLPSELDVMFALGSNTAGALLGDELQRWQHQGALHVLRQAAQSMGPERWDRDLVHGWLDTIAALGDTSHHAKLPQAMRTRAWGHRVLEAQLASWAELRRDNILYIKPADAMIFGCEFPSAYVEPNPAFFDRLAKLVEQGAALDRDLREMGMEVAGLREHFVRWHEAVTMLGEIVDGQLGHIDRTPKQRSFLRKLIELEEEGYGTKLWDGWFPLLYLDKLGWHADAVVADVHTAPEGERDDAGARGLVLHVGTGTPRMMLVTIDDGPRARAYVGPVSSFRRTVTADFVRLTDAAWVERFEHLPAAVWQRGHAPRRGGG